MPWPQEEDNKMHALALFASTKTDQPVELLVTLLPSVHIWSSESLLLLPSFRFILLLKIPVWSCDKLEQNDTILLSFTLSILTFLFLCMLYEYCHSHPTLIIIHRNLLFMSHNNPPPLSLFCAIVYVLKQTSLWANSSSDWNLFSDMQQRIPAAVG